MIAVTGTGGMLGSAVMRAINDVPHLAAQGFDREHLDITSRASIAHAFTAYTPDVVINCAGLTPHRDPLPMHDEYWAVNAMAPLVLARECDAVGARLIHVSTDCVFSGQRPIEDGPYTEADTPDATDPYGQSKAFGEVIGAPHLTVRCSFVGLGERGLIAALRRGVVTEGWSQAFWSGSTAPAIARALVELAQRPEITGLMHLTRGVVTSKADLIVRLQDVGLIPSPLGKYRVVDEPHINRWLASNRSDVPVLPSLHEALRELANG